LYRTLMCVASGVCCSVVTASASHACLYSSWSRVRVESVHFSTVLSVGSRLHMPTSLMCQCAMQK